MPTLRIADIVVTLVSGDPSLRVAVAGAAARFVVPDAGRVDMLIHVGGAEVLQEPAGEPLFDSGSAWRLYREGHELVFSFRSATLRRAPYRLARFDDGFTVGAVTVTHEFADAYGGSVPALQYPLDELLWTNLLARGRGIEVHACGVIDRGLGVLFAGQSGAGKSTISRAWTAAGATVVSDDRVVIRVRNGTPWLYGTPWHGDEQLASPVAAPLERILFLARGPAHAATPLTPGVAAARLLACAFPPYHDRDAIDFSARLAGQVATAIPCAELSFVPDPSVVDYVRGLLR